MSSGINPCKILLDNYQAANKSFLEYLHEKNSFHAEAFQKLCFSITALTKNSIKTKTINTQIITVYTQILKHIIYHFDPGDLSTITDMPPNYHEYLEDLDHIVMRYFK